MKYRFMVMRNGKVEAFGSQDVRRDLDFVRLQRDLAKQDRDLRRIDEEKFFELQTQGVDHDGFTAKFSVV